MSDRAKGWAFVALQAVLIVILIVLPGRNDFAIPVGSLASVTVGVGTMGFFVVKTNWEERRLTARYSGYTEYAARTPRFAPSPFGNHR